MKGIARTVMQLIYGSGLQRWLVRIGLVMTVLGFAALKTGWHPDARALFALIGVLAAGSAAISPSVVGAIMFRALSAPRSVQLIPGGRLKLLLGAVSTQLLLAVFIAASMTVLLRDGPGAHASLVGATTELGFMGVVFAYAFSVLTFIFINFYWAMQFPMTVAFIGLGYIALPQLLSRAFPPLHLGALLVTPGGLVAVLAASVLAWPVFAVSFIRQQHIYVPDWKLVGPGSSRRQRTSAGPRNARMAQRYGRQQAVQILLTGRVRIQRLIVLRVLIISVAFLAAMLINTSAGALSRTAFVWTFIICLFAAVGPAAPTGLMTRRAKSLWLTGRIGREELFMAIERQSWSMVLWVAGAAMALAIPLLSFSEHAMPAPAQLLGILVMPLTAGASGIYVSMVLVRGKRFTDTVLVTGYTVLLMVEMFSVLAQSPSSLLPQLLAANIIAIPLLRYIGLRRWQNLDWLIHKRSAAQLTG
jgi:hypothetical protein